MWIKDIFRVRVYKREIETLYKLIDVKDRYIKGLENKIEYAEKYHKKNMNTIVKQRETINKLWGMENDYN